MAIIRDPATGRIVAVPLIERFMAKVHRADSGCWLWTAGVDKDGYGKIRHASKRDRRAHCVSYELFRGIIPGGLTVDHLCTVPGCVNPKHLAIKTDQENTLRGDGPSAENARKTHCVRGHILGGDNLRLTNRNERVCRQCKRERFDAEYWRQWRARRKAAAAPRLGLGVGD
jgi:hypothetical protein